MDTFAGGIAGRVTKDSIISNSYVQSVNIADVAVAGGLIGRSTSNTTAAVIENSYVDIGYGYSISASEQVGMLIGDGELSNVTNSFYYYTDTQYTASGSTADTESTIALTQDEMSDGSIFENAGWDSSVWDMSYQPYIKPVSYTHLTLPTKA